MSTNDTNPTSEPELTKYGVACNCPKGIRPDSLEKTAETGFKKCPCCGRLWQEGPTLPYDKK